MSQLLNVHVRVNDESTGRPTPVRIRFGGPNGEYYPPLGHSPDFALGRNEDVGGHVYLAKKHFAYIDGAAEFTLPTGVALSIEISKGPAYMPVRQAVTLGTGQLSLRFSVSRCLAENWQHVTAADTRCHFLTPHSAKLEAAAEGLDLVHLLAAVHHAPSPDGHMYRVVPNLTALSGQAPALDSVYVNTFNVHPVLGRLSLLHSHRAVFPLTFGHNDETDDWSLGDWCDQCRRKKGLVIWSDAYRAGAGLPGGEALINAILGKVGAIEIDSVERSAPFLNHWYRLLDAGIRLPLVGSSGKDSNRIALGSMRTLTAPSSYSEWVEHVRAGRTVASNSPFLSLTVNEQPFESRLVHDGAPFRLRAEAASSAPFEKLELIANGEVIRSIGGTAAPVTTATLEVEHSLPKGGWLAARCWGASRPELYPYTPVFAHTSPCFVEVVGEPSRRQSSAIHMLAKEIEVVRSWVESEGRFTQARHREQLLSRCDEAMAKLVAGP